MDSILGMHLQLDTVHLCLKWPSQNFWLQNKVLVIFFPWYLFLSDDENGFCDMGESEIFVIKKKKSGREPGAMLKTKAGLLSMCWQPDHD